MKEGEGRLGRGGRPRLNPQEIIDRELGGLTKDLQMTDLNVSDVHKIQEGVLPGMSEKQDKLDDALRFVKSVMTFKRRKLENGDPNRVTYEFKIQGKLSGAKESVMTLDLDMRCVEAKWMLTMFNALSGEV